MIFYAKCFNPELALHFPQTIPLVVARPIYPTMCTKVVVKHQSSSSCEHKLITRFLLIKRLIYKQDVCDKETMAAKFIAFRIIFKGYWAEKSMK